LNAALASPEFKNAGGFATGYVYFRQMRDRNNRRGYFQKSVVILTMLPYPGLFSRLVSILAPLYFEAGKPCFESACKDISTWPPPVCGNSYELPFLGNLLTVELPTANNPVFIETSVFRNETSPSNNQIIASVLDGSLYNCFKPIMNQLWLIWELAILGEPLVIFASNPTVCSNAVHCIVDLIAPVQIFYSILSRFLLEVTIDHILPFKIQTLLRIVQRALYHHVQ
jgi:hypothetical protein